MPDCCPAPKRRPRGLWQGILFGLLPHNFCIAFIVLSVVGATAATGLVRKALLLPGFLELLIGMSLLFATLAAVIYLRRGGDLSLGGVRRRWRYLTLLYGLTLAVNLTMMTVVLPGTARVLASGSVTTAAQSATTQTTTFQVDIPCSGHAPLVTSDLKGVPGVLAVEFRDPNVFVVRWDATQTSLNALLSLEIFQSFKATVLS